MVTESFIPVGCQFIFQVIMERCKSFSRMSDRPWLMRMAVMGASLTIMITGQSCYHDAIERGTICLRLGDYSTAIELFTFEIRRHPDRAEARAGLGQALLQRSADLGDTADWKKALIQLDAAATLAPGPHNKAIAASAWMQRARQLLAKGDTLGGLEACSRSREFDPAAVDPLNLAGIVYFRQGDVPKAAALFHQAVALDSGNAVARFNRGMIDWYDGAWKEAHANWFAALKADPDDPDIIYWFAAAEKKLRESQPLAGAGRP
jgi:tetratricopeptide (TPR) repeat protein